MIGDWPPVPYVNEGESKTYLESLGLKGPQGGGPCASLILHLHQVGWKTFTSELLNMLGTQAARCRACASRTAATAKVLVLPLRYERRGEPPTMSAVLDHKRKIYAIRDLPTLPVIAQKVLTLADDDTAGPEKLASMISSDQALSARVLSLANSAYYGHRAKIGTIRNAMVVIGMNMLKQLSLSVLVCGTMGRGGRYRAQFWKHSFGTATASAMIAQRAGINDHDVCFMAGLLHDVGKMIIEMYFTNDAEMDHTEVGSWMAERWQLPPALVGAIANHHSLVPEHLSQPIVACVHAANVCAKVALSTEGSEIAPEVLRALHLSEDDFFNTAGELRNRRAQIDQFLM